MKYQTIPIRSYEREERNIFIEESKLMNCFKISGFVFLAFPFLLITCKQWIMSLQEASENKKLPNASVKKHAKYRVVKSAIKSWIGIAIKYPPRLLYSNGNLNSIEGSIENPRSNSNERKKWTILSFTTLEQAIRMHFPPSQRWNKHRSYKWILVIKNLKFQ